MARRSGISEFVRNFGLAYDLSSKVAQDIQIGRILNAKPTESQGLTADDGKQLEAVANAKDAEGNSLYKLTANEDGSYSVASAADPSQVGVIRQKGVTDFLGERTAGTLSADQVNQARQLAIAGVVMRNDPMAGAQMINSIKRDQRDDQRYSWEKTRNERDLRKQAQADSDEEAVRAADADAADWLKKRLTAEDGTERAGSVDDHLAATQYRAMRLAERGRLNEASTVYRDYAAQSMIKLQMDGARREQAIGKTAAALAAGDLGAVKDFYNDFIPDGARVTDVRRGKAGQIIIERETLDGRRLPQTVMKDTGQLVSALAAFKDPMAIYNYAQNEFRNTLAIRADARAGAADARAGAADARAAAAAGRDALAFNESAPQRQLKATEASMRLGMASTDDPEERQRIQERLTAMQGGGAEGKDQPAEVKLAAAMLAAGMAPDMRTALEMAVTKKSRNPDELHQDFVNAGIKNSRDPKTAVADADEVMKQMGYRKQGGRWSPPREEGASAAAAAPLAAAPRSSAAGAASAAGTVASRPATTGAVEAGVTAGRVPAPDKRKVGKSYDTPMGKMIWQGSDWEPAD